jgi:hypothetical protein
MKSPSKKSRGRRKSTNWNKKKRRTMSNTSKKDDHVQEVKPKTPTKSRKRKQMTDNEEEIQEKVKNDETSHDIIQIPVDDDLNNDLPIALRRSRRTRKAPTNETPSVTSSPVKSVSQVRIFQKI